MLSTNIVLRTYTSFGLVLVQTVRPLRVDSDVLLKCWMYSQPNPYQKYILHLIQCDDPILTNWCNFLPADY